MEFSKKPSANELLNILQVELDSVEKQLLSAESNCTDLRLKRTSLRSVISIMSESGHVLRG